MSTHQLLACAAQIAPHGVAMQYQEHSVTWQELNERVARRASHLAGLGMRARDRIGLLAANVPEHMDQELPRVERTRKQESPSQTLSNPSIPEAVSKSVKGSQKKGGSRQSSQKQVKPKSTKQSSQKAPSQKRKQSPST